MNKKTIVYSIITSLILGGIVYFYFRYSETEKFEIKGSELITKIEEYRKKNNSLPDNIRELGLTESMGEGPYYEKKDSINYIIYFNIGFDNTKIYYSQTKKWKDEP